MGIANYQIRQNKKQPQRYNRKYVKPFKMPNPPEPSPKSTKLLVTKLKQLREQVSQLGYSQAQFEHYVLVNIFGYRPASHEDVGTCLRIKLKGVNSFGEVQRILGVVDRELGGMVLGKLEDRHGHGREINDDKNRELLLAKKRKQSKQSKQSKKPKKTKAQKPKPNPPTDQNHPHSYPYPLQAPSTKNIFNLMLQARSLSTLQQSSNFSSMLNITNNRYNQQDTREEQEKEVLFQKILEIQMLSRLLCGGTGGIGSGFLTTC